MMFKTSIVVAAPLILACLAQGATVSPTKDGDFIAGIGIPSDNFTRSSFKSLYVSGLYLKARGRDSGQPLSVVGLDGKSGIPVYTVAGGEAASEPGASWWNFDFQLSPTAGSGAANFLLTLNVDTDPTAATSFTTLSALVLDADTDPLNSWDDSEGFFRNPLGGAWSDNETPDDETPWVISQSWRMDFSFLANQILGEGLYTISLSATPLNGKLTALSEPVVTTIIVQVQPVLIPLPSAAGMGLVGMMGLMGVRRRRG